MKVKDIAQRIEARLHPDTCSDSRDVYRVYCADTMSDLIQHAAPDTLLVTSLNNSQLIRVAELMDAPGICLASSAEPSGDLLVKARQVGTAILTSPHDARETCRRIAECLGGAQPCAVTEAPNKTNAPPGSETKAPPGAGAAAP